MNVPFQIDSQPPVHDEYATPFSMIGKKEELSKSKRGRKPANTEPATKRIAQVRSAARAYRERKEKYVADLEATVMQLQRSGQCDELRQRINQLELENSVLKVTALQIFSTTPTPISTPVSNVLSPQGRSSSTSSVSYRRESDSDQMLSQALFSEIALPPVMTETFNNIYDLNFDPSLQLDPELEALLNSPLPKAPMDRAVVEAYLAKAKDTMLAIPSLANDSFLINELFGYYGAYIYNKTDVEPRFCYISYGKIQVFAGQTINRCIEGAFVTKRIEDIERVVKLIEAITREFSIDICDCPDLVAYKSAHPNVQWPEFRLPYQPSI